VERVLTQGRVQIFYLTLLLWPAPSRLNLDHTFTVSRSLVDPLTTLLAFLFIAATIIFALRSIRSRPLLAFPVLGYWLLHSMESGPVNLELVFEHRMYLPMTMLALLIGLNLRPASMKHALSTYAILLVVGALLAVSTYQRNLLGVRGILDEAETAFEQAIRIKPDSSLAHNQLGNVYLLKNQLRLAEQHYRQSIEHDPEHAEPLFNLARILMSQGRYDEQRELLERFIQVAPPHLEQQKQWALRQLGR
jgi:tetratricopeptide (TPR) repeat protein